MIYLIDKNLLTKDLIANKQNRNDLCIIQEVIDEAGMSNDEIEEARKNKIRITEVSLIHLKKLKDLMANHGHNLKLINLYQNKGTADIVMIAFILGERDKLQGLFDIDYTILTNDKEVISLAKLFAIPTIQRMDF